MFRTTLASTTLVALGVAAPAARAQLPDLVITAATTTATSLTPGDKAKFRISFANRGSKDSPACRISLSESTTGRLRDARFWGDAAVPAVPRGKSGSLDLLTTIPRTVPVGTCHLLLFIDSTRIVSESKENNNTWSLSKTCRGGMDLAVLSLTSNKTLIKPGAKVALTTQIGNTGGVTIRLFDFANYLSTDSVITTLDTLLHSEHRKALLARFRSRKFTRNVTIPTNAGHGRCYFGAFVDQKQAYKELDETNNTKALAVTCRSAGPDLTAQRLTPSTTSWAAKMLVRVQVEVGNIGTVAAPASANGIYMSTDSVFSKEDTLLQTVRFGVLQPKTAGRTVLNLRIPATVANGACYLGLVADHKDSIAETNENNNTKFVRGVCIGMPDLVITALRSPSSSLRAGTAYVLSTTIKNQGHAAARLLDGGVFLSSDSSISTTDTELGGFASGSLGAGRSVQRSVRIVVPYYARAGTQYLGAIVDVSGRVPELVETNNTKALRIAMTAYAGPRRVIEWEPFLRALLVEEPPIRK